MNPYVIIAGLLLAAGLYFGGIQTGRKLESSAWQAKQIAITAETATRQADATNVNEILRLEYAKQTRTASENHANEIATINAVHAAALAQRVRVSPSFCMSSAPGSSQGTSTGSPPQDAARAQFLPDAFTGDLRQLIRDADEQVADMRQLVAAAKLANCFEGF